VTVTSNPILQLSDDLYCLVGPYELDGRPVSTHPLGARGFAPLNNYLFFADGEALMVDTGWPIAEAAVLEQLGEVITPETPLSILMLRQSDYNSVSNALPISEKFNVTRVMLGGGIREQDTHAWLEFAPARAEWREPTGVSPLARAEQWSPMGQSHVPGPGEVNLELVRSQLQLITTYWLYDDRTKTLLTSDGFTHTWRPTEEGPWTVTEVDDAPTVEELCDYLVGSRFWWLAGARTEQIRAGLDQIRTAYDLEVVAPAYGCVLVGRDVIAKHFELMDEALEELSHLPPVGDEIAYYQEETA